MTTQYVIKYTLNGERRFDFAHLKHGTEAEARVALEAIYGEGDAVIVVVKVSKAL